jgi:NAD(P)-dependent dehydrogenase (short-subunit alcohol dehydrogenase family)
MRPIDQQTILITGATDGVGRALAHELAEQGANLIVHGRNKGRGETLLAELHGITGNDDATYLQADFARLSDVHSLAEQVLERYERLDVLVNNAGVGLVQREESADGYEMTFQVNYLAGYVLAAELAPLLAASAPARIVNVSSFGQAAVNFEDPMMTRRYEGVHAYCQSKLAQILHVVDLAEALAGQGVTANAVHPAPYMPTKMVVGMFTPQSPIEQGMRNILRVATDPALDGVTGRWFNQSQDESAHPQAYDPEARARLRKLSEELTGVPFPAGLPG